MRHHIRENFILIGSYFINMCLNQSPYMFRRFRLLSAKCMKYFKTYIQCKKSILEMIPHCINNNIVKNIKNGQIHTVENIELKFNYALFINVHQF